MAAKDMHRLILLGALTISSAICHAAQNNVQLDYTDLIACQSPCLARSCVLYFDEMLKCRRMLTSRLKYKIQEGIRCTVWG